MKYGDLIHKIRTEKGLSLRKLATLSGCDYGNLGRLEKSHNVSTKKDISPSIDTLKDVCKGLDYPFRKFLEEAEYIEPVAIPTLTPLQKRCLGLTEEQEIYINRQLDDLLGDKDASRIVK